MSASLVLSLLMGCVAPAPHTYKIALVAPFEGAARDVGYGVFFQYREEIQNAIRRNPSRPWQVTFVAYNDNADPAFAARVAENVLRDPDVLLVIGHFLSETNSSALPMYAAAGLPVLTQCVDLRPPVATARCAPADIRATTRLAIEAIDASAAGKLAPTRAGTLQALLQP